MRTDEGEWNVYKCKLYVNGPSTLNKKLCDANISDTFTKPTPLCLVQSPPSIEPNLTSLAGLSSKIAHLTMLYILLLTCTVCSAD